MSKLKELEKMFTQGKLTRREFMARVSALGLMAAVSPALLGGKAEAATPKRGGKFILGSAGGSTTDSLGPRNIDAHYAPGDQSKPAQQPGRSQLQGRAGSRTG